jgi:hypothetical protein
MIGDDSHFVLLAVEARAPNTARALKDLSPRMPQGHQAPGMRIC